MKEKYLTMSNIPAVEWDKAAKTKLLELLASDERVMSYKDIEKTDENGRPLFEINSETLNGVYTGARIAVELHENILEREARLNINKWKNDIKRRVREIERLFFELDEITLTEARNRFDEINKVVPELKDGIFWRQSLLGNFEKRLNDVSDFECAIKKEGITHNNILRTINIYSTGRRIKKREESIVSRVNSFFQKYFNTADSVFDWSEYRQMYGHNW